MKKTFIKRLAAIILFAMTGANLFSQGFYVYTKDGQRQDYASENVDSIVFYEKTVEDDVSDVVSTPGEAIDLGLSVKWATCNVGASSPEEYGNYYAWGETATKSSYDSDNSTTYGLSISELESRGIIDSDGNLTAAYDAATANWGGSWRMPTLDEIQELLDNCTWTWTTQNGVNGRKVTGPNGNSIFLPDAGYRLRTGLNGAGSYGHYWSATPDSNSYYAYNYAYYLYFGSDDFGWDYYYRGQGRSVRPVSDELLSDSEK